jgi:hypothetical protein
VRCLPRAPLSLISLGSGRLIPVPASQGSLHGGCAPFGSLRRALRCCAPWSSSSSCFFSSAPPLLPPACRSSQPWRLLVGCGFLCRVAPSRLLSSSPRPTTERTSRLDTTARARPCSPFCLLPWRLPCRAPNPANRARLLLSISLGRGSQISCSPGWPRARLPSLRGGLSRRWPCPAPARFFLARAPMLRSRVSPMATVRRQAPACAVLCRSSLLAFCALLAASPCSSRPARFSVQPWPRAGALPLPRPASCPPATARSPSHCEFAVPPTPRSPWYSSSSSRCLRSTSLNRLLLDAGDGRCGAPLRTPSVLALLQEISSAEQSSFCCDVRVRYSPHVVVFVCLCVWPVPSRHLQILPLVVMFS